MGLGADLNAQTLVAGSGRGGAMDGIPVLRLDAGNRNSDDWNVTGHRTANPPQVSRTVEAIVRVSDSFDDIEFPCG